jgi:hypothetical protein
MFQFFGDMLANWLDYSSAGGTIVFRDTIHRIPVTASTTICRANAPIT